MAELSLQQAMEQFLKKSRLNTGIQAIKVEKIWAELMGNTISKYTDKIQIVGETLFITTSVAQLKTELMYQKDVIIKKINEALGENVIKKIVVK